ncbi:diguanylate cyclase domain-containing protein [Aerobium aerolatum]|uniref:PAS domain S-box-containing protein/diguanylate cyclase (GGDEF) domain-containing protein n=1 Tax=Aquamicrobium aerolatum DSM 21857 TaxID=1121003 RepID=A0A1I3RN71_9HYPH|nr:diguanylate cyclase [Aquamicrobium aerolatum]SFJ48014.1 PAS domain S-box-containing protein/diguanylate cyclase (GGDEF) domain-containing protein [Aquamicrobium aerolatum DSM 21857]
MLDLTEKRQSEAVHPFVRRTLDLLPDGVLIIGSRREVVYLNDAFKRLWHIPNEIVVKGDRAMLDYVLGQLESPETFLNAVERLYQSPESSEDEITFRDGRVFKRRSVALESGASGSSRIWIFSDFTEAWGARIDPLTGLLNRRAYGREIPGFMASDHSAQIKAFALIDVDHFKAFNDRYGHAGGDAVLERVGAILDKGANLTSHKAFRIGGEEFAIASVHPNDEAAIQYHQNIVGSIQQARILHAWNQPHGVVTISMGLGLFSGPGEPGDVFAAVDKALYRAKKLGRNRVVMATLDSTLKPTVSHVSDLNPVGFDPREIQRSVSLSSSCASADSGADTTLGYASRAFGGSATIGQLFDVLTHSVPGIVWVADEDGKVEFVNEAWCDYTGLSRQQSGAHGWMSALHPEDLDTLMALWPPKSNVQNPVSEKMMRIKRRDGVFRWHMVSANSIAESPSHWIGCSIDIHEVVGMQKRERAQAEILEMVAGGEPVQTILEALCSLGETQLPGSRCSVLLVSQDGKRFDGGAAPFLPKKLQELVTGMEIGPGVGSCGTAAFEKRDVVSANISRDPLWDDWRAAFEPLGVQACWSRPVYGTDDSVLATYGFYFSEVRAPTAEELESLENLRQLAAVAIIKARAHEALEESEEHHRFTVEYNPQIPWTSDPQGRILSVSSRWVEATGIPVEDALGNGWFKALHPDDTQRLVAYWNEHLKTGQPVDVKFRIRLKDGSYRWVRARASARRTKEGTILKWYGAVEDIDDVEQATERLRRQAYQDEVTRLPNRRAFEERLAGRLRDNAAINVLMLDINGFKTINERFGHEAGDAALRLFGRYLRKAMPQADMVARIAGDAFVVLLTNYPPAETLQRFAKKIGKAVEYQLSKSTKTRLCGVSIGCVEAQRDIGADEVVRRARLALSAARKDPNSSIALFTPALPKASEDRFDQIELARAALKSGWIMPVYQPKMDLRNGAIAGAEALLRIDHPSLGIQGPSMIWAALDAPRIGKSINDKMIALVLSDLSQWTPWPEEFGSVSINLSTDILTQPGLSRSLLKKLERSGISTHQLTVEITERVLVDQLSRKSHQALRDLRRHGVRVSLDDFGTGFASLTHLQQLPVNEIKIDQTFVRDLMREGPNAAIVKSMIGLGLNMGIDVVAEGVETAEQGELLREWGCRYAQGYFYHRPMPAKDFARLCGFRPTTV